MNTTGIRDYYADLLIMQYKNKPRARATVQANVLQMLMPQYSSETDIDTKPILPLAVMAAYNLDDAVGVQLDVLGKYLGMPRYGYAFAGYVTLDDESYRTLLRIVCKRNNLTYDTKSIVEFLAEFFPGVLHLYDYMGMHIHYFYSLLPGDNIVAERFILAGLLPRPLGVRLTYSMSAVTEYFGFLEDPEAGTMSVIGTSIGAPMWPDFPPAPRPTEYNIIVHTGTALGFEEDPDAGTMGNDDPTVGAPMARTI